MKSVTPCNKKLGNYFCGESDFVYFTASRHLQTFLT